MDWNQRPGVGIWDETRISMRWDDEGIDCWVYGIYMRALIILVRMK